MGRRCRANVMYIQPLNRWTRIIETYDERANAFFGILTWIFEQRYNFLCKVRAFPSYTS